MPQFSMHSPLGSLTLSEEDGWIVALDWGWGRAQAPSKYSLSCRIPDRRRSDGARVSFDLPLRPEGSSLRRSVWAALLTIPFGETRTYGDIASIARTAPRAVGQANRMNPIPIFIPCHRVVGREGSGGYSGAGGLATKDFLLELERDHGPVSREEGI